MQIEPLLRRRSEIDAVSPLQLSVRNGKKMIRIRRVWMACVRNMILKATRAFIIQVGLSDGLQIEEYGLSNVRMFILLQSFCPDHSFQNCKKPI
jgi:hypothetical protein